MREIKFRGKCLDNGEWVYGSLTTQKLSPRFSGDYCIFDGTWHVIDPDTVGQYTGANDRNGVEIYEGDIIIFHFKHHVFPDTFDERQHIYWSERDMQIKYDNLTNPDTSIDTFAETLSVVEQEDSKCWIEVIGNDYDNPELLEEL